MAEPLPAGHNKPRRILFRHLDDYNIDIYALRIGDIKNILGMDYEILDRDFTARCIWVRITTSKTRAEIN